MPEKTAVIVLADGAEEMEATISIDVLRRGEVNVSLFIRRSINFQVTVAGLLGTEPVKCSRGTVIVPEVALADVVSHAYDVVILPGGQPGTNSLASVGGINFMFNQLFSVRACWPSSQVAKRCQEIDCLYLCCSIRIEDSRNPSWICYGSSKCKGQID